MGGDQAYGPAPESHAVAAGREPSAKLVLNVGAVGAELAALRPTAEWKFLENDRDRLAGCS
jgi:hypothetical protein